MKVFTSLLLLVLFFNGISCDDLLSKFHQRKYKIRNDRIEMVHFNKTYYNFLQVKPFKYNRTTTAHNGTVRLKVDVQDKLEILVQCYKFMSNEYREFPVRYQVNLKKAAESNMVGLRQIQKCGNITFYFKKGITYYFCNLVTDETRFPPLIPDGIYRADLELLYLDKLVAFLYYYFEIYTPVVYPRK